MIPAWLARFGARLLPGLIAAGAFLTLILGVFRRGKQQAELEHDVADAKARADTERRMDAVPRVATDADLVRKLQSRDF